jgi:hypothetical protein
MEKRNRERLDLSVFCRVAPAANQRRSAWKKIENISGAGLLVEWSRADQETAPPTVGDVFSVELQLPPHPVFGQRALLYKAKVVRVSRQKNGRVLAGLSTTQTRFRSLAPGSWQKACETYTVQ